VELNPNFADAYANLGSIFLSQGKNAEAIEASEKALKVEASQR
jgi:tetratricopeptide (TPR) repeat protein